MTTQFSLRAPFLLASLLALGACSSSSSDPDDDGCRTDEDCPAETPVCIALGRCAAVDDAGSDADAGGDVAADAGEDTTADATPDTAEDAAGDAALDGSGDDVAADIADEEVTYPPLSFITEPADGEAFVALDATITVRFNQPMNALRIIASNIELRERHGDLVERVLEYDPDTYTVSIAPPEENGDLMPVTPYELRLSDRLQSRSGETLGEPYRMTFSTTGYNGRVFLRQLAEAYAPVVYQQVETAAIDTFTRVDFDGNDSPLDNLENADSPNYAYAYYDVIESESHWFITYLYYYPGSIPREGVTYEHDTVSVQVVVRKSEDDPLGELRAFSTSYHEHLNTWAMNGAFYADGDGVGSGDQSLEGRLAIDRLEDNRHVAVFIESGRHAVCLPNVATTAGPCAPDNGSDNPPFQDDTTGAVFRVAEAAERIGDSSATELGYSLRSFAEELYALRARVDGEDQVFGGEYSYNAPVGGGEEPRPGEGFYFPTALATDHDEGGWGDLPFIVNVTRERADQGVWFVDPAWSANKLFDLPETFSVDYCFNPYLGIDVRDENDACTPTEFSIPVEPAE